jgi:hypothetical protein
MNFQKILVLLGGIVLVGLAYRAYGWAGVAMAVTGGVMWMLLHFTRLMQVLKRAAKRPIGFVDSAVMLNAKLRPKVTLMHVIALTKSLGQLETPKDAQPEIFTWTDGSRSVVRCEFLNGRLQSWALTRPEVTEDPPNGS